VKKIRENQIYNFAKMKSDVGAEKSAIEPWYVGFKAQLNSVFEKSN
jgi:hypothetical protein